ncbi:TPA: anti-sigma factor antagonist [Candidatus Poribacteria bacterium]|nr:anti-sigma factor antagonist [Candidatus Poribacteria bacterium]
MPGKFTVSVRREDGYAVLETGSYLNQTAGEELFNRFNELLEEGYAYFIINMSRTKIVNSIGISILIEMLERLRERGGKLIFCNLSNVISKTFKIMGLTQYAGVYPSEEEAISALRGES